MKQITQDIENLLRRTGIAHGVYEESVLKGVYDQEWATWYATWALEHGLNDLLHTHFDIETVATSLIAFNESHKHTATGEDWAQFTARRWVETYYSSSTDVNE